MRNAGSPQKKWPIYLYLSPVFIKGAKLEFVTLKDSKHVKYFKIINLNCRQLLIVCTNSFNEKVQGFTIATLRKQKIL
jgi:hypothetical protein